MEAVPGTAPKDEGVRLLKEGKLREAIEQLEKALALDPDDPRLHTYLGAAYNGVPDKLHAIHHFEESLRLAETPKGYYNLGLVYESVHRVDEAVRQYRMALDIDPNYANAQEALKKLQDRFDAEHQPDKVDGQE
jgi:tetratricopeptide (TPR) repeat protein